MACTSTGHLPERLRGIGVHQHAAGPAHGSDRGDVVDHADLVVGVHQRHQHGVGTEGGLDLGHRQRTVTGHRQDGDVVAVVTQRLARVEHALVLGGGRHDVAAARAARARHALDGEIVGFGGPGREDDLARRRRIERGGDPLPCLLHRRQRLQPDAMTGAGRVAEHLHEVRSHGGEDPGVHRGRRVIVEVDGHGVGSPRSPADLSGLCYTACPSANAIRDIRGTR